MVSVLGRRTVTGLALTAAAVTAGAFTLGTAANAAPAEATVRGTTAPGAIAGQYIVVINNNNTTTTATALAGKHHAAVQDTYTTAVKGFSAKLTSKTARQLAADPAVAYVEQDHTVSITATQTNPTWGLDRIDQPNLPLSKTYTTATTGTGVTAYVIDTGVRLTHTQFAGRATSGYDFVDNDRNATDCQGHGTHVAGTIASTTYGVAKAAKIVAVRVLDCSGAGTYSNIIAGVDWVTKHAVKPAVANMSLGGSTSDALDAAVRKSIASGVTYAVAGGNDSANACAKSPARTSEAITVGATDNTDKRASFSNFGTCLDLFAPGVNILSAANTSNTATATMSGTSMASPEVAGAIALYLSLHPTATPAQVRQTLITAATTGKVTSPGSGSPNKLLNITSLNN